MVEIYGRDLAFIHHISFSNLSRAVASELVALLEAADLPRGLIVDLACGSGLLASYLTEAGHRVLGVDVSSPMVDLAKVNAPRAQFEVGSLWDLELPRCIAILGIGEGLSYFAPDDPRARLPSFLRRSYESLEAGGYLIFDVIVNDRAEPMKYRSAHEGPDWQLEVDVKEDLELGVLTRSIAITRRVGGLERRSHELHTVRVFRSPEIEELLVAAGFSVRTASSYGAVALPPRRRVFIARKDTGFRTTGRLE